MEWIPPWTWGEGWIEKDLSWTLGGSWMDSSLDLLRRGRNWKGSLLDLGRKLNGSLLGPEEREGLKRISLGPWEGAEWIPPWTWGEGRSWIPLLTWGKRGSFWVNAYWYNKKYIPTYLSLRIGWVVCRVSSLLFYLFRFSTLGIDDKIWWMEPSSIYPIYPISRLVSIILKIINSN